MFLRRKQYVQETDLWVKKSIEDIAAIRVLNKPYTDIL
jgi:hypothetical protein